MYCLLVTLNKKDLPETTLTNDTTLPVSKLEQVGATEVLVFDIFLKYYPPQPLMPHIHHKSSRSSYKSILKEKKLIHLLCLKQ